MDQKERLRASLTEDGRFRLLIDAITDYAIYMLDPQGRVSSWNAGAQRLKGYDEAEILGEHFSRFYTEEDRLDGLPSRALQTSAATGKFEAEGWRVRKNGERFWAHVVIDPILAPNGDLLGFAKITRDLTERKIAQESLRRSEEQFRSLVQGVTDYSIYMIDPTGIIESWNLGAQRIKGYAPEEVIGHHFSRFYTPEDKATGEPARALDIATRDGRFEKEGWRVRKDGSTFWAHVIIDAIYDDDGGLIGFAKVTRDITERRAAQRALEETRERLMQSQKMEAVGQLTGGIAHDFNNLLMVVLSSLEMLRRRLPANTSGVDLLDNATQAAQRGAALTQRMLAFARRQELKAKAVDVPELVLGMSDLLQRSIGPAVQIETRFPLGLPRAYIDANQLELVLLNLAVNARDAMPEGGIITVAGRAERIGEAESKTHVSGLHPGTYFYLTITDTGSGMDEATLARATEPFFTTKGIGKGTGLGLAMAHGFAAQSGGTLRLKSRPDVGTTAEIWLPVAAAQIARPADVARARPPVAMRKLRVLAVDDDPLVLLNTVEMLRELGHEACHAGSALQALDILDKGEVFDLLITDQAMPGMTGLQLTEQTQALRPDMAIVIATGYAELDGAADRTGFVRLGKPFSEDMLAASIAQAFKANDDAGVN